MIHKREPGKYCGPGILCKGTNGKWVDGVNTHIEDKQAVHHLMKLNETFPELLFQGDNSDSGSKSGSESDDNPVIIFFFFLEY